MRTFTPEQIQTALEQLKTGLDRYVWLQRNFRTCDVRSDLRFQTASIASTESGAIMSGAGNILG
jgi:hypothetical protein